MSARDGLGLPIYHGADAPGVGRHNPSAARWRRFTYQ